MVQLQTHCILMSVAVGCTALTIELPDSHKKRDKHPDSTYSQVKIQVLYGLVFPLSVIHTNV
jgi:hypothetical protein